VDTFTTATLASAVHYANAILGMVPSADKINKTSVSSRGAVR
jgi:hypothetical protein